MNYSKIEIRKEIKSLENMFKMKSNISKIDIIWNLDYNIPKFFVTDNIRLK